MRLTRYTDRIYPIVIAILLATGVAWLEQVSRAPDTPETANNQTPDFVANQIRVTGFDKNGSLRYTLDSPHLAHFPLTDSTHVDQPRLLLINQERRMLAAADSGEVSSKGERVELTGKIEIDREGLPGQAPLHLSTEKLTIWPQEQRAASDVPVRLVQGNDYAVGNHLTLDNVFGLTNLSGKVRMHFTPHHQRNP